MATFTLSQEQYEALIALARAGATTEDLRLSLDAFLQAIEKANGITRYKLWIQWQEMDQQVPTNVEFPRTWPPELRYYMELVSRPISRADVGKVLAKKARKPTNVLVTSDPAGIVGWSTLDSYFVT